MAVACPPFADKLATTRLGITLGGLRKLRAKLIESFGEDAYARIPSSDLNLWVEDVTAARKCRLLEMPEIVEPEDVLPPNYFISHACALRV